MVPPAEISDEELHRRAAAGSEAAFTALYRRHHGRVYRFAFRMSGCREVAEEATQEVFLLLIREPGRFKAELGALGAFLLGVARRLVLRHLERGARQVAFDGELAQEASDELVRRSEIETVRRAIAGLPARYREVVVLCELEEVAYEEAARVLECPVGTVRSRLNRARALLKARLAGTRAGARCVA
jgi:RNA polymerase sigma-70 factor (ECF subfamily)